MLAAIVAVLLIVASTSGSPVATESPSHSHDSITSALNEFSVSLFSRLSQDKGQENLFASPLSVSTALSMILLGAKAGTADEITRGLHYDHLAANENQTVHQQMQQILESSVKNGTSVSLANYLLIEKQEGVNSVLANFKSQVADLYEARVDDVDFKEGDKVVTDVNTWVNEKTRGLVKSMLSSPPDPDCKAIILNAIYFKGEWDQKFSAAVSSNKTFYNRGTEETTTPFMQKMGKYFPYSETMITGRKVQVLELPYDKDSLSMLILLPEARTGLKDILSAPEFATDLTTALSAVKSSKTRTEVNVYVPKFKIESEISLKAPLQSMGMGKMFSESEADLSGITGQTNLYVRSGKHKAVVNVDEDGTEAAAVTMFDVYPTSARWPNVPPKDFRADHPFLFLIQDQQTGLILFVGKVEQL